MSPGACRSNAVSVVVTPLILSKSLSVKTATFIGSGRHFRNDRGDPRRPSDQVVEQIPVEAFLHHEVEIGEGERERDQGQPEHAADDKRVFLPAMRFADEIDGALLVEAAGESKHVFGHREVAAFEAADDAAALEQPLDEVAPRARAWYLCPGASDAAPGVGIASTDACLPSGGGQAGCGPVLHRQSRSVQGL